MLSNSERFVIAHKTAKQIRSYFDSYRGAFAYALSEVYAMEKQGTLAAEKSTAEKLEGLGIAAWERDGMRRYYINDDQLEAVFGLSIGRYKTGNISSASLNGEGISNSKAYRLIARGIWYDANADRWMQKTEYGTRPLNDTLAGSLRV
jgi:hypothetical protein